MWFLQLIPFVGKFFDFGNNVTNAIRDLQLSKVQAKSDKEKAEIQERIDQLNAISAVNQSDNTATNKLSQFARFVLFGLPAGLAIWKLVVFDKIIGSLLKCAGPVAPVYMDSCKIFRTDPLDANMWWVIGAAVGFYLITTRK